MDQYWRIINICQKEVGIRNGGPELIKSLFHKQNSLVRSLTLSYPSSIIDTLLKENRVTITSGDNADHSILCFPNELLLNIIEQIPELLSVVCFALTCKRILSLSRDPIVHSKRQGACSWAGGRVICVSEYTSPDDLPKGLLHPIEDLMNQLTTSMNGFHGQSYGGMQCHTDRYADKDEHLRAMLARCHGPDRARVLELYDLRRYPRRNDWVVCNITEGVYVRAAVVARIAGRPDDPAPFLPNCMPDLGFVILYRICWSSRGIGPTGKLLNGYKGDIARGSWAGHRFAITTLWWMPNLKTLQGTPWADISEEVASDLHSIFSTM
ncbi:hypothetical protein C8Q80DRAFT_1180331 [Daedaleopsis nitida]|nr:hypothetical protein C8Q80DRAFT_1180331 [Daedaleopsis nitida]